MYLYWCGVTSTWRNIWGAYKLFLTWTKRTWIIRRVTMDYKLKNQLNQSTWILPKKESLELKKQTESVAILKYLRCPRPTNTINNWMDIILHHTATYVFKWYQFEGTCFLTTRSKLAIKSFYSMYLTFFNFLEFL